MSNEIRSTLCLCCGLKRPSGEGVNLELCQVCFDEAGMENAHADGNHEEVENAACHACMGLDPHAGMRPAGTCRVNGQGKVLATTDGRLKANRDANVKIWLQNEWPEGSLREVTHAAAVAVKASKGYRSMLPETRLARAKAWMEAAVNA